ncbi:NUMOD4 domain-containing protein [Neobacillus sp. Marseille-QA0830]
MTQGTGLKMKEFWKVDEEWRDIKGFEGLYQVSNFGQVKSLARKGSPKEKLLKQSKLKNGYLKVTLSKDGKQEPVLVHYLVSEAFIPKTDRTKRVVDHFDGDKQNNCVLNLEWVTWEQNSQRYYFDQEMHKKYTGYVTREAE